MSFADPRQRVHRADGDTLGAHEIALRALAREADWVLSANSLRRTLGYLPIQKLPKMRPSSSSAWNSPVMSSRLRWAARSSSATSSPARCSMR